MRWVVGFEDGRPDASDQNTVGCRSLQLHEMRDLGVPVPPWLTITTEAYADHVAKRGEVPAELAAHVEGAMLRVEAAMGAKFACKTNPLLVSVRPSPSVSMPGMLDTILNLGLNDQTVEGLAARSGDRRFALDSYRRLIQIYSSVVLGSDPGEFEDIIENHKTLNSYNEDTDLSADDWAKVIDEFKATVQRGTGKSFPQNVHAQLWGAISAVLDSVQNPRAITYRRLHGIQDSCGTAINVQAMVFGNMGNTSGTGVAFTRNPSTGQREIYGEFLLNAQGEEVLAGIRTPQHITKRARVAAEEAGLSLEELMPATFEELSEICGRLESRFRDMQDVEFTIQQGKLWLLETRIGKRTKAAALKIAVDLVQEGIITSQEALMRTHASVLRVRDRARLKSPDECKIIAVGQAASPGVASGQLVFSARDAVSLRAMGKSPIFVCVEVSPDDIKGIHSSEGLLTIRGGMTSHAAVVARGMSKPCVCGAGGLQIDMRQKVLTAGGTKFLEGDFISLDGNTGIVFSGIAEYDSATLSGEELNFLQWCNDSKTVEVIARVATAREAMEASSLGGEGIALSDWDSFILQPGCEGLARKLTSARNVMEREPILRDIFAIYRDNLLKILSTISDGSITTSLWNGDLLRFAKDETRYSSDFGDKTTLNAAATFNDIVSQRGCRAAITNPELLEAQMSAIFDAVRHDMDCGANRIIRLLLPNVIDKGEVDSIMKLIRKTAMSLSESLLLLNRIEFGVSVEVPRTLMVLDELARSVDFVNFDIDKLTEAFWGLTGDEGRRIVSTYGELGILHSDPLVTLDVNGVGKAVATAVRDARKVKPDFAFGIEGGQVCDQATLEFFQKLKPKYVCCQPQLVPMVRLVAAKARLISSTATSE